MKKKILLATLLASLLSAATGADEIRADAPQHYTVVKGDTLWDIAARFLRDPWAWPAVWQANPAIHNPHLIYPGNVILLCTIDAGKVLAVDAGEGCAGVVRALHDAQVATVQGDGVVRLEPQIQDMDNSTVIPTLPLRTILPYLNEGRVVDSEDLRTAPYVVAGSDQRLLSGTGDSVFVRGTIPARSTAGYALYHPGGAYIDPDTGERLGVQADYVARVELGAKEESVTSARILSMKEVVRNDDRLLALPQQVVTAVFTPESSKTVKPGRVLRILGGVDHGGKYSVIVINRGERDGVHQGHVFALYRHGSVIDDPHDSQLLRLPRVYEGLAMAFRTFPSVSYLLVLKAHQPVIVGDDTQAPQSGDD